MSVSKYLTKKYRFIFYSAKLLVATKLKLETNVSSQKKRKPDSNEISLFVQNQACCLANWIDSHTGYDFAVISHEAGRENTSNCFRCCEDLASGHQNIMVYSDNPKQIEKTMKSFVRHEGKVLYEIQPGYLFLNQTCRFLSSHFSELSLWTLIVVAISSNNFRRRRATFREKT